MGTGSAKERELANLAIDNGWWAKRAGASGGGTKTESYDVILANDGDIYVVELKYRDPDANIYVDSEEVSQLRYVARQLGATPLITARWKRDTTFYGYKPSTPYRTPENNLRLKADDRDNADFLLG